MLWPRQRRTNRARRQLLRGDGRGANPRHVGPSRIDCARRPSGRLGQTPPYPTAATGVITAPTGSSCTKAHADALGGSDNGRRTCGAHNRPRGPSGGSRPPTRTKPRPRRSSRSDPRALGCARTSHADQTAPTAIITIRPAGPRVRTSDGGPTAPTAVITNRPANARVGSDARRRTRTRDGVITNRARTRTLWDQPRGVPDSAHVSEGGPEGNRSWRVSGRGLGFESVPRLFSPAIRRLAVGRGALRGGVGRRRSRRRRCGRRSWCRERRRRRGPFWRPGARFLRRGGCRGARGFRAVRR
jgi:hypothetical protein